MVASTGQLKPQQLFPIISSLPFWIVYYKIVRSCIKNTISDRIIVQVDLIYTRIKGDFNMSLLDIAKKKIFC